MIPVPPAVRILVEREGVIRVPYSLLVEAGFPVEADPRHFYLRRGETPWTISVLGEDYGSFDAGDAIEFVAAPFDSREMLHDVYWLEVFLKRRY